MKNVILSIALAFAFAVPMASTQVAQADPWYSANSRGTTLWQHSFGRGNERCKVGPGGVVNRHWGENWSRWIYVRVGPSIRSCRGWADKQQLSPHVKNPDKWYVIKHPNGALMRSLPLSRTKCHVPNGEYLFRGNEQSVDNDAYILVEWQKTKAGNAPDREFADKNGKTCTKGNHGRIGWVKKADLDVVVPVFDRSGRIVGQH